MSAHTTELVPVTVYLPVELAGEYRATAAAAERTLSAECRRVLTLFGPSSARELGDEFVRLERVAVAHRIESSNSSRQELS